MSKIFVTSDNHFSHRNIHKFCPATRPDVDIDVMDRKMIARWQEQVGPDDDVFALGDFFFCDADKAKSILNQLPGRIHLIYGNHDKVIRNDKKLQSKFYSIQEYKELSIPLGTFILFHYPIQEWNKMARGAFHLHGHIHEKLSGVPGRIMNVCVDSSEIQGEVPYSLYAIEDIATILSKKEIRIHHGD